MPLRERVDMLRLKTGQPISEDWFDHLADVLIDLSERGAVSYEGYVYRSLIPYKDKVIDLGSPAFEFDDAYIETVHASTIYAQYMYSTNVQSTNVKTTFLDVFSKITSDEIETNTMKVYDEIDVDKLTVHDQLYVYGYAYLGTYVSGYRGSFHEIDVDFLLVYDSLQVPNYSIGFVKLDPRLISTPLRSIDVPTSSSVLMPRGVWYVNLPSGVSVEVLFGANWIPVLDSKAGLVVSDGVNVRITNSNTYDVSVQAVFIR